MGESRRIKRAGRADHTTMGILMRNAAISASYIAKALSIEVNCLVASSNHVATIGCRTS